MEIRIIIKFLFLNTKGIRNKKISTTKKNLIVNIFPKDISNIYIENYNRMKEIVMEDLRPTKRKYKEEKDMFFGNI